MYIDSKINIGRNTYELPSVSTELLEKILTSKQIGHIPFALECVNNKHEIEYYMNVPRTDRFDYEILNENLILPTENVVAYELVLDQPSFFPIYTKELVNLFDNIEQSSVPFFMQLLIKEVKSNTVINSLIEQYFAYLRGVRKPSKSIITRYFQEKFLDTVEYFKVETIEREPVGAIEQKLKEKLYQVQIRFLLFDPYQIDNFFEDIYEIVKPLDYFNGLRFRPVETEHLIHWEERKFTPLSKWHIFSKSELTALLYPQKIHTNIPNYPIYQPIPAQSTTNNSKFVSEVEENPLNFTENDEIIEEIPPKEEYLLPYVPRNKHEMDESIVELLNQAMKQSRLITEPLKVFKITQSATIQKVQFHTTSQHVYSKFIKEIPNLKHITGHSKLDIGYGDEGNTIAFYIPRDRPEVVYLQEIMMTKEYHDFIKNAELPIALGECVEGKSLLCDLVKATHILLSGTTNSGKSVCITSLTTCLLLNKSPLDLEMYMIDPKKVELSDFADFPHVKEVVTDMGKATHLLDKIIDEMERRYDLFSEQRIKKLSQYNEKFPNDKLPYIVLLIDEYADLKAVNPSTEDYLKRIAQKGRASGIHMIVATQRPSADVVNPVLRNCLPTRIAFNVPSEANSKIILDEGGAENLLGFGDGILKTVDGKKTRFQGAVISTDDEEVNRTMDKLIKLYGDSNTIDDEVPEKERVRLAILHKNIFTLDGLQKEVGIRKQLVGEIVNELIEEGFLIREGRTTKLNPEYM